MITLETLRGSMPDAARDIKLNLAAVLAPGVLSTAQRSGVAIASAIASRHAPLTQALLDELGDDENVVEDAKAAAALMAMNNVFYRFRHMVGKPEYEAKPARLRMNRLVQARTNRTDLELMSLAVSAINGCEACVRSHEQVVREGGLSDDHVFEAVRIASVIHAAAVALEMAALSPRPT